MTGMVTYAGLDVHARSTHAAAIDVETCELVRARFGPGRAVAAAGVNVEVIAPGKTPRGPSDRVKTDRKDAELLARRGSCARHPRRAQRRPSPSGRRCARSHAKRRQPAKATCSSQMAGWPRRPTHGSI